MKKIKIVMVMLLNFVFLFGIANSIIDLKSEKRYFDDVDIMAIELEKSLNQLTEVSHISVLFDSELGYSIELKPFALIKKEKIEYYGQPENLINQVLATVTKNKSEIVLYSKKAEGQSVIFGFQKKIIK